MKKKFCLSCFIIGTVLCILVISKTTYSVNKNVKTNTTKYQMGDKVKINGLKIYITSTRRIESNFSKKGSNEEELFLIRCSIENSSKRVQKVSSLLTFKIRDEYGNEYDEVGFIEDNGSVNSAIKPGDRISGEYVVRVDSNLNKVEFILKENKNKSETVINLC